MQREILERVDAIDGNVTANLNEIRRLAREDPVVEPPPEGGGDDDPPEGGILSAPYLIVGMAETTPGGQVDLRISGHTNRPVTGFELAFGLHRDLDVVGWEVHPKLLKLLDLNDPSDVVERNTEGKAYGKGNYVHAYVAFFEQLMGAEDTELATERLKLLDTQLGIGEITPDEHTARTKAILAEMKKRVIKSIRIPQMTPMLTVSIRVLPAAAPGTKYQLLCRSMWFGRRLGGNNVRLPLSCVYSTDRDAGYQDIDANLLSGSITVI